LTDAITDKKLSRRQFVGAAAGGAAALGAGAILAPTIASAAGATPVTRAQAGPVVRPLASVPTAQPSGIPASWDYQADVVVIGAGAAGQVAAIAAAQGGSSVLIVEENYDVGGHAMLAGGHMDQMGPSNQVFASLTEASTGTPYQDRALSNAYANNMPRLFDWLISNGMVLSSSGSTYVPCTTLPATMISVYAYYQGVIANGAAFTPSAQSPGGRGMTGMVRIMENTARSIGVQYLLNWKMTGIIREGPYSGNVLGVTAQATGGRFLPGSTTPLQSWKTEGNVTLQLSTANIRANKAVIICDGGHSSNPARREEFDFRQTGLYHAAGEPYSFQNGDGLYAARRIGAALWATGNEADFGSSLTVPGRIGAEYLYANLPWTPASPIFPLARATGLSVASWDGVCQVNMAGARFIAENTTGFTWINAAMDINAASAEPDFAAGPTWAIFDSAFVTREGWTLGSPNTDPLFFYQANDLPTLAQMINSNVYQVTPMDGTVLQATVTRYNSLVTAGKGDTDFGKTPFTYQISAPPYYAAFDVVVPHDCLTGIRMNTQAQVLDLDANVIPHLYVAGESAGGFAVHGVSKCMVWGLIAGTNAAQEPILQ